MESMRKERLRNGLRFTIAKSMNLRLVLPRQEQVHELHTPAWDVGGRYPFKRVRNAVPRQWVVVAQRQVVPLQSAHAL